MNRGRAMDLLLEVKNLVKSFTDDKGEQVTILKGLNLDINRGEFVAIMGQSGSGKSTLLYNISGMDHMTSGQVRFKGEDFSSYNEEQMSKVRLEKMGFIFQQPHFLKNLSLKDNIIFPGLRLGKRSNDQVKKRAEELMKRMNILEHANYEITKVSGGQLQRASICRALINEPEILFADEPTGALNSSSTQEVMNIINTINAQGTAVLVVTHDAKVAARAERVIYLADGKIEAECALGKFDIDRSDMRKREEKMRKWLCERGF